jgi:hypothetical protein
MEQSLHDMVEQTNLDMAGLWLLKNLFIQGSHLNCFPVSHTYFIVAEILEIRYESELFQVNSLDIQKEFLFLILEFI